MWGFPVTWTAAATDTAPLVYQFSVAGPGARPVSIVRDFSSHTSFVWAPMQEGNYTVTVAIKEGFGTSASVATSVPFTILSRVTGTGAVVTQSVQPLVALYSAPPCSTGTMEVIFRAAASPNLPFQATNALPCAPGQSMNFYVAGMKPNTAYYLRHVYLNGSITTGISAPQIFTTGSIPSNVNLPPFSVLKQSAQVSTKEQLIFYSPLPFTGTVQPAIATDLSGNVLWYYNRILVNNFAYTPRLLPGGTLLVEYGDNGSNHATNVLREVDLSGNPIRETNVDRVNEQLVAMGVQPIVTFHHEANRFPNGQTVVLGMRMTTLANGKHIMGDQIIALDANFQVVWTWDGFAHLGTNRLPVLGETCIQDYWPSCPVADPLAIDWMHSNTLGYSPADGNLILSMRNQDWVIKIDYRNGTGMGNVLWRLGQGGDFALAPSFNSTDWFSHQHDVEYVDNTTLSLFDNGNTRCQNGAVAGCHSRGQILTIDETQRVVTPTLSADLGNFSLAFGSAQRLSNGNYSFASGFANPGPTGQSIEVTPTGAIAYIQAAPVGLYRAFRMPTLYGGTALTCACQSGS